MNRLLLYSLSFVLVLASCSRKEVNVREHIDVKKEDSNFTIKTNSEEESSKNIIYANREAIYKALKNNDQSSIDKFINEYLKLYINDFFYAENVISHDNKIEITDMINTLILKSSDAQKHRAELLSHVYSGCDEQLNTCVKYALYPKVKTSIQLIISDVKSREIKENDLAKILLVLNSNRGIPDPELFLIIMENRDALNTYLSKSSHLSGEGKNIVDLAINQVKSKSESSKKFRERYCKTALDSDLVEGLESPLRTYSQKENTLDIMIYCKSEISVLVENIKNRIKDEAKSDEGSFLSRYSKKKDSFFKSFGVKKNLINLFKNKDGKTFKDASIELFVIDRFFNEKIPQNVAIVLMDEFGNLSDYENLKLIDEYIKSYFAYRTDASFNSITGELKSSIIEKDGLSSAILVDVTQNVAKKNYEIWAGTIKRFSLVLDFIDGKFGSRASKTSFDEKARKLYFSLNKKLKLNSLTQTIKQNVEQPMQLFLTYFLSKLTGQVKFYFPWSHSVDKYVPIESRNALVEYVKGANSLLSQYSLFQFTATAMLLNSEMKVRTAVYKAIKFGLFEKIPFDVEEIKANKPADLDKNIKMLMTQLYDHLLQSATNTQADDYNELKRKYLSRNEIGIKKIRSYCEDPFNAFLEATLTSLNTNTSFPVSSSDNKAPMVFLAYSDAVSRSKWNSWMKIRGEVNDILNMIILARPEKHDELHAFANESLKKYEDPFIKTNQLKERLKKEIFGTRCLEKIVHIEQFRVKEIFTLFDTYFRKIYLTSNLIKKMNGVDEVTEDEFKKIVDDFATSKKVNKTANWLKKKIELLFSDEDLMKFFKIKKVNTAGVDEILLTKKQAQKFLKQTYLHHNREIFEDKIGFRANGVISVENSKNFILQDFVSQAGNFVSISKWEFYLKAQNLVENHYYTDYVSKHDFIPKEGMIYPEILFEVRAQSKILQSSSSLGSTKINLDFSSDLDIFLKEGYKSIFAVDQGSFFTWFKPGSVKGSKKVSYLSQAYQRAIEGFKVGPVPLNENWASSCFSNETPNYMRSSLWFSKADSSCVLERVDAAEVIDEYRRYLNHLRLTEEDLEMAVRMEAQSVFGEKLYDSVKIKGLKSHEWRWFDRFYYTEFASFERGNGFVKVNIDAIPDGHRIVRYINEFESTARAEKHILYDSKVFQFLRNKLRYAHYEKMDKIFDIENAIFDLEKKEDLGVLPIELVVSRQEREKVFKVNEIFENSDIKGEIRAVRAPINSETNNPTYLDRRSGPYPWFWGNYNLYYEKQSDCFLIPRKNDFDAKVFKDYVEDEKLNCRRKSKKFINELRQERRSFNEIFESI